MGSFIHPSTLGVSPSVAATATSTEPLRSRQQSLSMHSLPSSLDDQHKPAPTADPTANALMITIMTAPTPPPASSTPTPKKKTTKEIVSDLEELAGRLNVYTAGTLLTVLLSLLLNVVAVLTELRNQDLESKGMLGCLFHQWRIMLSAMLPCLGLSLPFVVAKAQARRRWRRDFGVLPMTRKEAALAGNVKTTQPPKSNVVLACSTNLDPGHTNNVNTTTPKESKGRSLYLQCTILWMLLLASSSLLGLNRSVGSSEQLTSITTATMSASSSVSSQVGGCNPDPQVSSEAFGLPSSSMTRENVQAMVQTADEDLVMESEWPMSWNDDEFDDKGGPESLTPTVTTADIITTVPAVQKNSLRGPKVVQNQTEESLFSSCQSQEVQAAADEEVEKPSDDKALPPSDEVYEYVPVLSDLLTFLLALAFGGSLLGIEQSRSQVQRQITVFDRRLESREGIEGLRVHKRAIYKKNRGSYWVCRIVGFTGIVFLVLMFFVGDGTTHDRPVWDLVRQGFYGLWYYECWMPKNCPSIPTVEEEQEEEKEKEEEEKEKEEEKKAIQEGCSRSCAVDFLPFENDTDH